LVQQYNNIDYNLVDGFTISPEELDTSINKLRKYFNFVMQKMLRRSRTLVNLRLSLNTNNLPSHSVLSNPTSSDASAQCSELAATAA
jgi:hypothetical protein